MITPQELISYSVFPEVKNRAEGLLKEDIRESEREIYSIVGHEFDETDDDGNKIYPTIPDEVKLSAKKLSQFYSLINSDEAIVKGFQSESLDGYSYTLSNGGTLRKPDIYHLLHPYIKGEVVAKKTTFRMRSV